MSFCGSKQSIPQDIIIEIFSWLPVKSLMRFKCVSKYYNSLVSKLYFVDIHRYRSMTRPGGTKFLIHDVNDFYSTSSKQTEDGKVSLSLFQTENFNGLYCSIDSSLDCVNDLFCVCEPLSVERGVIFNPTTREVRFLPDLNKDISWRKYSLGFEEVEKKYKLQCPLWFEEEQNKYKLEYPLWFEEEEKKFKVHYSLGFEEEEKKYKVLLSAGHIRERYRKRKNWILTLGIDKSWREITKTISPDIVYCMPGVSINGVIYRFAKEEATNKRVIAAFDIKSEKFNIIASWNSSQSHQHWKAGNYMMIEVKGNLAVADCENWLILGYIHLRILEEKVEWKSHTIHFPSIWKDDIESYLLITSLCKSDDGDILFIVNLKSRILYLCYDFTRKSWREVEIEGFPEEGVIKGGYSYVESLLPFR